MSLFEGKIKCYHVRDNINVDNDEEYDVICVSAMENESDIEIRNTKSIFTRISVIKIPSGIDSIIYVILSKKRLAKDEIECVTKYADNYDFYDKNIDDKV